MAGLLQRKAMMQDRGMEGGMQGEMQEGVPEEEPQETQTNAADPQSQTAYDQVVSAAMKVLYDDKMTEQIVAMLKAGADKPEAILAQVVVMIVTELDRKANGQIPKNVIVPASEEIIALVAELAEKSGAFTADPKMIERALAQAMQMFKEHYKSDPGEVESMMQRLGASKEQMPDMGMQGDSQGGMQAGMMGA